LAINAKIERFERYPFTQITVMALSKANDRAANVCTFSSPKMLGDSLA